MIPEISAEQLYSLLQDRNSPDILDLRSTFKFLAGFIPGSINLPAQEQDFLLNLRKIWPYPKDVVLISTDPNISNDIVASIEQVGGRIVGYVDFADWKTGKFPLIRLETISAKNLQGKDDLPNLIDVRSKEEWAAKTIPNSKNIPLAELDDRLAELDKSKKYIAFCAGTYRGLAGAARLRAQGFDVLFLPGGVSVWDDQLPEANAESSRERGQEK